MKKLVTILTAGVLMVLGCAVLFTSGAIYDSAQKLTVEPYFFQPDNLSSRRIGVPASPADLGATAMRDRLIRRYVTEYFYAVPVKENVTRRSAKDGTLAALSTAEVFNQWTERALPQIQDLTDDGKLRLVKFSTDPRDSGIIKREGSDYWEVQYELHTWDTPNNLATSPQITRGSVLLKVFEESGIRDSIMESGVHEYLDSGKDPVTLFKFRVTEVAGL